MTLVSFVVSDEAAATALRHTAVSRLCSTQIRKNKWKVRGSAFLTVGYGQEGRADV